MVNLKKKIKIEGAYLMAVCPHNYERKKKQTTLLPQTHGDSSCVCFHDDKAREKWEKGEEESVRSMDRVKTLGFYLIN